MKQKHNRHSQGKRPSQSQKVVGLLFNCFVAMSYLDLIILLMLYLAESEYAYDDDSSDEDNEEERFWLLLRWLYASMDIRSVLFIMLPVMHFAFWYLFARFTSTR